MPRDSVKTPTGKDWKIVRDRYQKERGNPQMLEISCANCGSRIIIYQKDGPGALIRCYLDRISWPPEYQDINRSNPTIKDLTNIECPDCGEVIATPMVYKSENRLAYRMIRGKFVKKKYKRG